MARQLDVRWIWLNLGSRSKARFKKSPHSISTMDDDDDDDRSAPSFTGPNGLNLFLVPVEPEKWEVFMTGRGRKRGGGWRKGALKKDR